MTISTVDPWGMGVRDWTDAMTISVEQYGNLGRLNSDDAWREWGAQLLTLPGLSGSIVPDPYAFGTWQEWAERLNDGLAAVM